MSMTTNDERPPYRVLELAERWRVNPKLVRDAIKSGRLKAFRLNKMDLIPAESVERMESGEAGE
jgi:hypothetical protein